MGSRRPSATSRAMRRNRPQPDVFTQRWGCLCDHLWSDRRGIADPTPATIKWEAVGQAPLLELCGEIAHSQTFSPSDGAVYVITCGLTIRPGVTLTLSPGTIIKSEGAPIEVEGSLVGTGTAEKPVTLTSWRDDSVRSEERRVGRGWRSRWWSALARTSVVSG